MSANSTAGTVALIIIPATFMLCVTLVVATDRDSFAAPRGWGIAAFIAHSESELSDPFTGKPYHWDAASNAVTFEVAADRDRPLVPWPL